MTLRTLREQVFEANQDLVRHGLVISTFGNASGFDRSSGMVAIKPSGVPYAGMTPDDLVVTNLDGRIIEGTFRPSSDLPTHLALYRAFEAVNGIAHTHSRYATAWAQAGVEIPCLGTTHADYFRGAIPVTDVMAPCEIESEYELNTAAVIIRRFASLDPLSTARSPGLRTRTVLVGNLRRRCGAHSGDSGRARPPGLSHLSNQS